MSSNSTPVSRARSFAQSQAIALVEPQSVDNEQLALVAVNDAGTFLLGSDATLVRRPLQVIRLFLGTRESFLVAEGQVEPAMYAADFEYWAHVKQGARLRWTLKPDVVVWHCPERGPHAFLYSEWFQDLATPFLDPFEASACRYRCPPVSKR